jgi:hypothetical protein
MSKELLKKISLGTKFYGLQGQEFWMAKSKTEKIKMISKIIFWGFHPDFIMGLTSLDEVLNSEQCPNCEAVISVEDTYGLSDPFGVHYYNGTFSSGSGSDPIYVFKK